MLTLVSFVLERYFGIRMSSRVSGGYVGLFIYAAIIGFSGSLISLMLSRWSAKMMYGIEPIREERLMDYSAREQLLYTIVAKIAKNNGINMPEVGMYESEEMNAFATGASKNSALVAASSGLLLKMDAEEIEGVIGHEMAHVLNGDMVTMTLLQGVLNTFVIFASRVIGSIIDRALSKDDKETNGIGYYLSVFILEIVFGIIANLVLMAYSRHREYQADEGSAKMLGKARMIKALKRLAAERDAIIPDKDSRFAAMKISSKSSWLTVFSTHPDISDRIRRLEENYLLP